MGDSLITRVPDVADKRRHQRAHDQLAGVLNSLLRSDEITPSAAGPNEYTVAQGANLAVFLQIIGPRRPYGHFGG